MLKHALNGFFAGVLISVGGAVYLACDNKIAGAVLFSVALLCICYNGYNLYTGKICYIPEKHDKEAFSELCLGLVGNVAGCVLSGLLIRLALPNIGDNAETACAARLLQPFVSTLIRGFFCGILIYLAVFIFKEKKTPVAILFCIPVFILSGYEHSVADIFYFAASGICSFKAVLFILTVIVGNSLGGMLIPGLRLLIKEPKKAADEKKEAGNDRK